MADWWDSPDQHVLGGRDNYRSERGTWLGVTKQGRLACLTNFREQEMTFVEGRRSRGAVVNSFLKTPPQSQETTEEVAQHLIEEGVDGIGGFSLLFGRLRNPSRKAERNEKAGLAIVSNRSKDVHDVTWLCQELGETHTLSNTHYSDRSWHKVLLSERMVEDGVKQSFASKESKETLINRLLSVLSTDDLPKREEGEEWDVYLNNMRNSIFVPAIGDEKLEGRKTADDIRASNGTPNGKAVFDPMSGVYGTQKQTVLVVDRKGMATFMERTLFDSDGKPVAAGQGDRRFEFEIEGW